MRTLSGRSGVKSRGMVDEGRVGLGPPFICEQSTRPRTHRAGDRGRSRYWWGGDDVHGIGPSPESSRFREGSTTTRRTDDRPNRRFTRVRRFLRQTGAWCRIVRARDRKSRSLRSPTFRADRGIRSTRGPSQASARSQEDPDRRQGEGSAMHGPVRGRRRLAHASGFGSGDGSIDRAGRGRRAGHSHGGG